MEQGIKISLNKIAWTDKLNLRLYALVIENPNFTYKAISTIMSEKTGLEITANNVRMRVRFLKKNNWKF